MSSSDNPKKAGFGGPDEFPVIGHVQPEKPGNRGWRKSHTKRLTCALCKEINK